MIPFRDDQFDRFNNGQIGNRPMLFIPSQQAQIMQTGAQPTLMFAAPTPNFHQPYHGNSPITQPNPMFITNRPRLQQSWMVSSPVSSSNAVMSTFIRPQSVSFHQAQSTLFSQVQPTFSGGTVLSQSPFNGSQSMPPPLIGSGTGIPQPPFSGGTAVLKRKSHYIEESDNDPLYDNELPSLMNLPSGIFTNMGINQPQQYLRPNNPRFIEHNGVRSRFVPPLPPPPPPLPPTDESFINGLPNPPWMGNNHRIYSSAQPNVDGIQQQLVTSQLFQKHQSIPIDMILKEPGRAQRPPQILIVLRGLPGSGKSYVADLIKNEEELQSKGTNKPKILSIDNYFLTENQQETKDPKTGKIMKTSTMEYEYDPQMEEMYRRSLIKLVRKSIDDRFFPFLIVDQNNEQLGHFRDFVDYAEANRFQVYFVELNSDIELCVKRNVHKRTLVDIEQTHQRWETLPLRYEILDIRSLLQSDAIDEVEMDDASVLIDATTASAENELPQENKDEEEECQITKKSKWEAMMETDLDRLDGVYQRRAASSPPIEKWLNNAVLMADESSSSNSSENVQLKKKKVRWADIEENALHLHKKAVGFVVGQTAQDWRRMSDSYDPSQKLNQYKYI